MRRSKERGLCFDETVVKGSVFCCSWVFAGLVVEGKMRFGGESRGRPLMPKMLFLVRRVAAGPGIQSLSSLPGSVVSRRRGFSASSSAGNHCA